MRSLVLFVLPCGFGLVIGIDPIRLFDSNRRPWPLKDGQTQGRVRNTPPPHVGGDVIAMHNKVTVEPVQDLYLKRVCSTAPNKDGETVVQTQGRSEAGGSALTWGMEDHFVHPLDRLHQLATFFHGHDGRTFVPEDFCEAAARSPRPS